MFQMEYIFSKCMATYMIVKSQVCMHAHVCTYVCACVHAYVCMCVFKLCTIRVQCFNLLVVMI